MDEEPKGPELLETSASLPTTAAEKDRPASEKVAILGNCTTLQCGIGRTAELSFSLLWNMLTDPLGCTVRSWEKAKWIIEHYFAILSISLGVIIAFIGSNIVIFFFRKFKDVCKGVWSALVLFRHLPTIDLILNMWGG